MLKIQAQELRELAARVDEKAVLIWTPCDNVLHIRVLQHGIQLLDKRSVRELHMALRRAPQFRGG